MTILSDEKMIATIHHGRRELLRISTVDKNGHRSIKLQRWFRFAAS